MRSAGKYFLLTLLSLDATIERFDQVKGFLLAEPTFLP
jgi:hypothetical protein